MCSQIISRFPQPSQHNIITFNKASTQYSMSRIVSIISGFSNVYSSLIWIFYLYSPLYLPSLPFSAFFYTQLTQQHMYSIHSLAHRAPASRTRVRWQPYGTLPPSGSTSVSTPSSAKSPSSTCSVSPFSSATSSPISASQCDSEPPKQHTQSIPQPPRDAQPRDKNKFALGLVGAQTLFHRFISAS